jgi:hypothetical protein
MKKSDGYRQLALEGIEPYSEKTDMLKYGEKAIAVDFDGVINSFKNGWKGPTETDEPVLSAAESIATLFHRGYKIIIFSTRAGTEEGVKTIREYILKHTEDPGLVEKIEITDKKPIAHVYIDDRAIPFTGNWAETLEKIETFRPWNESDRAEEENKYVFLKLDENGLTIKFSDDINEFKIWNHYGFEPEPEHLAILEKEGLVSWTGNDTWYYILQHDTWRYMNLDLRAEIDRSVIEKALTYSGYPLQGRTKIHGMDISIENKKGSTRSGTDKDGHEWHTHMNYDYGYIRGTVGKDKDHLDCYVGPDRESERVFIVHQNDPVTGSYDEDKVMLGFDTKEAARKAYLSQYDRPGFLGDIVEMGIEEFKGKIFDEKNKGKMIKALFMEDELRGNVRFLQAIYDLFKDEEKSGKIDIFGSRHKMKDLEGFPKGLDLENCEPLGVEKDKIWFTAGGDWQQSINFAVELKGGKLRITNLYDGNAPEYDKKRMATLIEMVEMAGSMMNGGLSGEN